MLQYIIDGIRDVYSQKIPIKYECSMKIMKRDFYNFEMDEERFYIRPHANETN